MKSLASKTVVALAAVAVPALAAASLLGFMLVTTVAAVKQDINEAVGAARQISEIRVLSERDYGLVSRLPAEIDQDKVTGFVEQLKHNGQRLEAAIAGLGHYERIVSADILDQIRLNRDEKAKITSQVVDATRSFAQTTALELVNGPFGVSGDLTMTLLDAVTSTVNATTDKALARLEESSVRAIAVRPLPSRRC